MTQTIKIKRSTGSAAPSTLATGELAYSKGSDTFYVGDPAAANTPIPVGGAIKNNAGTPVLATGVTAAEIRTLIDVDQSGTDNSTNVSLSGAYDYLTLSGQAITLNQIDLTTDVTGTLPIGNGGTGATTASAARTALGVAIGSDVLAHDANLQSFVDTFTLPTTDGSSGQVVVTNGSGTLSFSTVSVTDTDVSVANLQTRLGEITSATTIGSGASADFTFASDVVITGNLTINGTTTTVNSETLTVDDNIIVLNNNVTGTPTENAGIEIERGTSANVLVRWNESSDRWEFTNNGTNYYNIPLSTEYTNNAGTVTSVGGTGSVNGISLSGTVTSSGNLTLGGTLSGVTIDQLEATDIITSAESFVDTDGQLMTAAAIDDLIVSKGYTSNVGDITSVQILSTDASISGVGTGSTGAISFDLEVATIDGGVY